MDDGILLITAIDCGAHASYVYDTSSCPNNCLVRNMEFTCTNVTHGCRCNTGYIFETALKTDEPHPECVTSLECGCYDHSTNRQPVIRSDTFVFHDDCQNILESSCTIQHLWSNSSTAESIPRQWILQSFNSAAPKIEGRYDSCVKTLRMKNL